jgi:hypothetical protein
MGLRCALGGKAERVLLKDITACRKIFYPDDIDLCLYPGNNSDMGTYTAFERNRRVASGSLEEVTRAIREKGAEGVFVYEDATGRVVDLDPRGSAPAAVEPPRGRGRPNLGVVAREVTLLPRHWDWLSTQPGGASVALRKLVEEARRTRGDADRRRAAQESAYRFMSSIAGDFPGFEEALRALFAYDRRRFGELVAAWPEDVRDHAVKLAFSDLEPSES